MISDSLYCDKRMKLGEEGWKFSMGNFFLANTGKKLEAYYKQLLT